MSAVNRRSFLQKAGFTTASAFLASLVQPAWSRNLQAALREAESIAPGDLAPEEDFWYYIQQSFTTPSNLINLNNGGVSPAPKVVQEAMKSNYDFSNEAPSYNMWRLLDGGRETLRASLAELAGASPKEIAINRNTTEGLETIIFGLSLKRGDEVVACRQDYPNMINAWKQRELREGIKIVWVNLELPSEDEDYLVRQYVTAFTSRTRVVHLTHIINWNGQILPVRKIADEAARRGIQVVVDGAHSLAHIQFKIPDLGADYFASSLHKWLYAPIGCGLLYVKRDRIRELYPLFASDNPLKDDIRKFEHLGTRPFYIEQAITKAIGFHEIIGAERKEKRLHYLKNYWMERVKDIPKVALHTSPDPKWGCAIGLLSVKGEANGELERYLLEQYRIHTTTIKVDGLQGVRLAPNVYTSIKNLDLLVEAVEKFTKHA
jgi:selenocysteine lyase/cysteine desulfurase